MSNSVDYYYDDEQDVPLNFVGALGIDTDICNYRASESGAPFNADMFLSISRHDDLKQMLDSNRDNLKLEAMKRIIGVRS